MNPRQYSHTKNNKREKKKKKKEKRKITINKHKKRNKPDNLKSITQTFSEETRKT